LTKASLPSFITSSRGSFQEESDLPWKSTNDRFDLNTYKLMKKFGYDFSKRASLGYLIEAKPYGLNDTKNDIELRDEVVTPKIFLGYIPPQPTIRILGWDRDKQSLAQYIITEEVNDEGENA